MGWVVDTCLIIDVLEDDPAFGTVSARLIDAKACEGLVVCAVTYIELAPAFLGDRRRQDEFLRQVGIDENCDWTRADIVAAYDAWQDYVTRKRQGKAVKRPIADLMIGAFACRHYGLLTRNPDDFTEVFPDLNVVRP